MVQGILIRSLLLSSVLGMILSTSLPAPLSNDNTVTHSNGSATSKDCTTNSTLTPAFENSTGLSYNKTKQSVPGSDDLTSNEPIPHLRLPEKGNSTNPIPFSLSVPGIVSDDGRCTCPGVLPVSRGFHAVNSSKQIGSSPPIDSVKAENTTLLSTNETSATTSSFLKLPTNLCLLTGSVVVGINTFAT